MRATAPALLEEMVVAADRRLEFVLRRRCCCVAAVLAYRWSASHIAVVRNGLVLEADDAAAAATAAAAAESCMCIMTLDPNSHDDEAMRTVDNARMAASWN